MNGMTNSKVRTPIGEGISQGRYLVGVDASGDDPSFSAKMLVRLPVNEATRPHLNESLTPRASVSGLWVFSEIDLL